jgi:hypothetical protein
MHSIWQKQFYDWQKIVTIVQHLLPFLLADKHSAPPNAENFLASMGPSTLEMLRHHRLSPLLYREVMRHGLENYLEPSIFANLRNDYFLNLRTAAREEAAILRVVQALMEAGIDIILLKGADLRIRIYGESSVRPMADLDMLISPEQVSRATLILEKLGFSLQSQCSDPRPGFRERFRNELHFAPATPGSLLIDLHWHLSGMDNFYVLPFQRLWEMAIPLSLEGQPLFKVLCPEHALIHLALHSLDELHGGLQIIDLCLALSNLPWQWPDLRREIVHFHCQMPVYLILRELAQIFPEIIPVPIIEELSGYQPSWAEKLVINRSLGYLTPHFAVLYRKRLLGDWLFYLSALLWPRTEYLIDVYGVPNRVHFIRQFLKTLLSSNKSWQPHQN